MKKLARILPYSVALIPSFALAQDLTFFSNLIKEIKGLVDLLIPLLIAIAVLYFIWGLIQFIANAGDEAARAEGKTKMIWGIVALFVIVSIWGLVGLLGELTGVDTEDIDVPDLIPN